MNGFTIHIFFKYNLHIDFPVVCCSPSLHVLCSYTSLVRTKYKMGITYVMFTRGH